MTFELGPGERLLSHEEVRLVEDRRGYPATIYLTDRRLVLTYAKTPPVWVWAWAWMVALVMKAAAHAREQVRHEIHRDRFGSVEEGADGILVFHDTGEGYAHTSFAIKSDEPHGRWHVRMQRWIAGDEDRERGDDERLAEQLDDGAELPRARIVER